MKYAPGTWVLYRSLDGKRKIDRVKDTVKLMSGDIGYVLNHVILKDDRLLGIRDYKIYWPNMGFSSPEATCPWIWFEQYSRSLNLETNLQTIWYNEADRELMFLSSFDLESLKSIEYRSIDKDTFRRQYIYEHKSNGDSDWL